MFLIFTEQKHFIETKTVYFMANYTLLYMKAKQVPACNTHTGYLK
jgi:hypothetical protein